LTAGATAGAREPNRLPACYFIGRPPTSLARVGSCIAGVSTSREWCSATATAGGAARSLWSPESLWSHRRSLERRTTETTDRSRTGQLVHLTFCFLKIIISAKWTEWNWRIYCFQFCVSVRTQSSLQQCVCPSHNASAI